MNLWIYFQMRDESGFIRNDLSYKSSHYPWKTYELILMGLMGTLTLTTNHTSCQIKCCSWALIFLNIFTELGCNRITAILEYGGTWPGKQWKRRKGKRSKDAWWVEDSKTDDEATWNSPRLNTGHDCGPCNYKNNRWRSQHST